MKRVRILELISLNTIWIGLAFMWNGLHLLILPAVLLNYVNDAQKNTTLGLLTFSGLVTAMIIQPIAGTFSDRLSTRFGRRRPLIFVGTVLDLIFLGLLATAGSIPLIALSYLGLQFTSNLAHGSAQGLMHDRVPLDRMGVASGIKNMFDVSGLILASLLLGRIFSIERSASAYLWIGGILLGSVLITVLGVREEAIEGSFSIPSLRQTLSNIFLIDFRKHWEYVLVILTRLLFMIGLYGVQTFAQYFIRDTLKTENPIQLTGNLIIVIVFSFILSSLIAGFLSDHFGRKSMHAVAAGFVSLGALLMMTADTPGTVLVYGSLGGIGIGFFNTANWALANDLVPQGQAGKFLGLTNLATAGAAAISRLLGPMIDLFNSWRPNEYLGYSALFLSAAILSIASLFVLRRIPDRPIRNRDYLSVEDKE